MCNKTGHTKFNCFLKPNKPIRASVCKICGASAHTSLRCSKRQNKPLKTRPDKEWRSTKDKWFELNQQNFYYCYLQISNACLKQMDNKSVVLDHVVPKGRGKKYKYDVNNLKPSCMFCNSKKGSQTLEALSKTYPHLRQYL